MRYSMRYARYSTPRKRFNRSFKRSFKRAMTSVRSRRGRRRR